MTALTSLGVWVTLEQDPRWWAQLKQEKDTLGAPTRPLPESALVESTEPDLDLVPAGPKKR